MEYNRAQLKESVKQVMRATRPRPIWITLLYLVITTLGVTLIERLLSSLDWAGTIVSYFLNMVLNGADPEAAAQNILTWVVEGGAVMILAILVGTLVTSLITYLWRSAMLVGFKGYCVAMVRGQGPKVGTLFQAFPRIGGILLTRLLVGVFAFLWSLLFTLGLVLLMMISVALAQGLFAAPLLILIDLVAYAVAMVWLSLRYSLADYALLDGESGLGAIRASKKLMKGNYRRLFVLRLSFIGWYLIMFVIIIVGTSIIGGAVLAAAASGGAGLFAVLGVYWVVLLVMMLAIFLVTLWLSPYITGCTARFYDFLRGGAVPPLSEDGGWGQTNKSGYTGDYSSYTWTDKTSQSGQSEGWGQPQPPQEPKAPEQLPGGTDGGEPESSEEGPKDPPPSGPSYPQY